MRIATLVLDSTYGRSAVGVQARLERANGRDWRLVADARTDAKGCIDDWDGWTAEPGLYRIVFDSDGYFTGLGMSGAYPEVVLMFRIREESAICQLQLALSPHSFSTYFGYVDSHIS
jgi:5-hydroxyisourate hydrolase